jgi:hypothetical protein
VPLYLASDWQTEEEDLGLRLVRSVDEAMGIFQRRALHHRVLKFDDNTR